VGEILADWASDGKKEADLLDLLRRSGRNIIRLGYLGGEGEADWCYCLFVEEICQPTQF
jgi:hypothetical protein